MVNLRESRIFHFFILMTTISCSTSTYRVVRKTDFSANIYLSSNRAILKCEWLHDADIKGRYGFSIHVLDEENTVLSIIQGNTQDKKGCDRQLRKINKILKRGRSIEILGMGNLDKTREKEDTRYTFPRLGTFQGNGRVLQFMAIVNEHKDCFDAYNGDEKGCYEDSFQKNGDGQKQRVQH